MTAYNQLSAAKVKAAKPGKHCDGNGLWLIKRDDGGGQWMLRTTIHGQRREMGLGGILDVSLKDARELAAKYRNLAKQGLDPIRERNKEKLEQFRNLHLLEDIADDAFATRKAELRDGGKAGRWMSPLKLHVLPKLGKVPIADITQIDLRDTLAPIWHEKADTARKAMNRLNICFKHAAALGLNVDIQAIQKAKALLGKQDHTSTNIPSLPWQDVPGFYNSLADGGVSAQALRLLILTGSRSKPIRFVNIDQIDGDVWTIPAEIVKGQKGKTESFRLPLSKEALALIETMIPFSRSGYLFPGVRRGVISDASMAKIMKTRGMIERPHGFRASFRTWLSEETNTQFEVAEMCIGHKIGSKVVKAYQRSDFLEQRREIMQHWANFVTSVNS